MITPLLVAFVGLGPPCISTNTTITASNGVYYIDGNATEVSYGASTLRLTIETDADHALRFHHEGGDDKCLPVLTAMQPSQSSVVVNGTKNGFTHQYVYGSWQAVFPNYTTSTSCRSGNISLVCVNHGYMGGKNRLVWNDKCTASSPPSSSPPSSSPPSSSPPLATPPPDSDRTVMWGCIVVAAFTAGSVLSFLVLVALRPLPHDPPGLHATRFGTKFVFS